MVFLYEKGIKRGIMGGKVIYCPRCKRKVATWDGKSKINVRKKCENCEKVVLFHVDTQETEIIATPQRKSSSGVTFY